MSGYRAHKARAIRRIHDPLRDIFDARTPFEADLARLGALAYGVESARAGRKRFSFVLLRPPANAQHFTQPVRQTAGSLVISCGEACVRGDGQSGNAHSGLADRRRLGSDALGFGDDSSSSLRAGRCSKMRARNVRASDQREAGLASLARHR